MQKKWIFKYGFILNCVLINSLPFNLFKSFLTFICLPIRNAVLSIGAVAMFCLCVNGQNTNEDLSISPSDSLQKIKNVQIDQVTITDSLPQRAIPVLQAIPINFANELAQQSVLYVRSYAAGGSSGAIHRGTTAAHLPVYWNGFEMNSAFHGQTDLSLLPATFIDGFSLNSMPNEEGSGGIAGRLNINLSDKNRLNHQKNKNQLTIESGSFGHFALTNKLNIGFKKLNSQTKIYIADSPNNYTYDWQGEKRTLENAASKQAQILQNFSYQLNNKNKINASVWWYNIDRQIPPIAGSRVNGEGDKQLDKGVRGTIEYKKINDRNSLSLSTAFFDEWIVFNASNNHLKAFKNKLDVQFYPNKTIEGFVQLTNNNFVAEADDFSEIGERQTIGFFSFVKWKKWNPLAFQASLQQEWANDLGFLPFSPSLGVSYQFANIHLDYTVAQNYRYPTLNDWYWSPGGNPDLKAEVAFKHNLEFVFEREKDVLSTLFKSAFFHSNIDNWIQWTPGSNGVWMPENLKKVRSYGLESFLGWSINWSNVQLFLNNRYTYVSSQNQIATSPFDQSVGKQLPYIPKHKWVLNSGIFVYKMRLNFTNTYTSQRFTTSDNSSFIEPYFLTDFSVEKIVGLKRHALSLALQINNIFNKQYQTISQRPMPGRAYQIAIKYELFTKKHKE